MFPTTLLIRSENLDNLELPLDNPLTLHIPRIHPESMQRLRVRPRSCPPCAVAATRRVASRRGSHRRPNYMCFSVFLELDWGWGAARLILSQRQSGGVLRKLSRAWSTSNRAVIICTKEDFHLVAFSQQPGSVRWGVHIGIDPCLEYRSIVDPADRGTLSFPSALAFSYLLVVLFFVNERTLSHEIRILSNKGRSQWEYRSRKKINAKVYLEVKRGERERERETSWNRSWRSLRYLRGVPRSRCRH